MRKLVLLLAFACLPHLAAWCPAGEKSLSVIATEPIRVFDPMLWAFQKVESNFDTQIINKLGYGGILQIGQEMVDEVNRLCDKQGIKKHFILEDRLDSLKSVQIWYIVQTYHNSNYNLRRACVIWNPTASERYYKKIKREYNKKRLLII